MELGWIDYSEADRKRAMAVLAALQEPTAVDEIGIGIARDAFAQKLFPATSTLMTRAKYFFVVPYALRDMERDHLRGASAAALRRKYDDIECSLAKAFITQCAQADMSTAGLGIIGARSLRSDCSGKWVKRGPASMYWAGLRQLGFLKDEEMGYDAYFRYVESLPAQSRRIASEEEKDSGWNDDDAARSSKWHIPSSCYANWYDKLTLGLTKDEASFLAQQITTRYPDSLYALILNDGNLRGAAFESAAVEDSDESQNLSWGDCFSIFCRRAYESLPGGLAKLCRDAVFFSDFVYALRIRYNAQLNGHEEEAETEWENVGALLRRSIASLDIDDVFKSVGIWEHAGSGSLFSFLKQAQMAFAANDIDMVDNLVRVREYSLKGTARSKIGRPDSQVEAWRGGRRLSYRFEIAFTMINEIVASGGLDA